MSKDSFSQAMKLGGYVISVLGAAILIYNTFHVPLAKAIEKEKDCRITSDDIIKDKLTEAILDQKEVNSQLLIAITGLRIDMKERKNVR